MCTRPFRAQKKQNTDSLQKVLTVTPMMVWSKSEATLSLEYTHMESDGKTETFCRILGAVGCSGYGL
jgi:hypothetical protein